MIVIVQTTQLAALPPMISLMNVLRAIGEEFLYVGFDYVGQSELLDRLGFRCQLLPYHYYLFREHPLRNIMMKILRPLAFYRRRKALWRILNGVEAQDPDLVLWSCEMRGAALLGDQALKFGRRHISTLFELGDEAGRDWFGFDINRHYQSATIVECEYNRAQILMAKRNLPRIPFVVPNKFYGQNTMRGQLIADSSIQALVNQWGSRKVFLYQGSVEPDRRDLVFMLETLCRNFPECVIAVMGRRSGFLDDLSRRYSNLSLIPFVSAPNHLAVTSHAHIGIAVYNASTFGGLSPLNAVYCAPNKIYEYAGFGIPTLGNNNPGLVYSVEACHAGECVREMREEEIVITARKILDNYEQYSLAARAFFDAVDLPRLIRNVLLSAREVK